QRTNAGRGQGRQDGERVNVALVQHAEHDVHQQQGAENHQRLPFLGRLEHTAGATQTPLYVSGHADRRNRTLDGQGRLVEADARRQIEVDVLGRELPVVADAVFLQAPFVARERCQRHAPAVLGDHADLLQYLGMLGVGRIDLHHHLVLVERFVDGGDLPLTESVVEQRGHGAHVDAQSLGRVTVDLEADLLGALALVGIDAGQLGQFHQRAIDLWHPGAQSPQVAGQQGVGVLRAALPAATELQILVGHQEQPAAGHLGLGGANPFDDLLRGYPAFFQMFGANEHERMVDAALPPEETADDFNRRIGEHGLAVDLHLRLHHLERKAVVATDEADQLAGVLLRQEYLRHLDIEHHV